MGNKFRGNGIKIIKPFGWVKLKIKMCFSFTHLEIILFFSFLKEVVTTFLMSFYRAEA